MTRVLALAAVLLAVLLASPPAAASDEPRTIVVLTDRGDASTPLRYAAPVLRHLGLVPEPHDAAGPLPDLGARGDLRGVLIWLDDGAVGDAAGLIAWVTGLTQRGVPVVLMGRLPAAADRFGLFLTLGLIYARDDRAYGFDLHIVDSAAGIAGHERRFEAPFPPTDIVRTLGSAESAPVLVLQRRSDVSDRTVPLVATARGAYAADGYALWRSADGRHTRWLVDPVAWFRLAFQIRTLPVPDATTLNSRRIFSFGIAPAGPDRPDVAFAFASDISAARPERPIRLLDAAATASGWAAPANACGEDMLARLTGHDAVIRRLTRGETPRRVAPYAPVLRACPAERASFLAAANAILNDASSRPLATANLSLSDLEAGQSSTRIERVDAGLWRITGRGALNTLRFDDADHLRVDWERSAGVIGAGRVNGALYVSLDPEATEIAIAVTNLPWTLPPFATLVESRWAVSGLVRDIETAEMSLQGYGTGDMVWSVEPHSDWELRFTPKGGSALRYRAEVGADGLLAFSLPALAADGASLSFERQDFAEVGP